MARYLIGMTGASGSIYGWTSSAVARARSTW